MDKGIQKAYAKVDRPYNNQTEKSKIKSNGRQKTIKKPKDWATRPTLNKVHFGAADEYIISAPFMSPVMLLLVRLLW